MLKEPKFYDTDDKSGNPTYAISYTSTIPQSQIMANIEPCSRNNDSLKFENKSCPAKKPLPRQNCCPETGLSI